MKLTFYLQSLSELLWHKLSRQKKIVTETIEKVDEEWIKTHPAKILLFDIDDTLSNHGRGLNQDLCEMFNRLSESKSIVLVTNCSDKRKQKHEAVLKTYHCRAHLWPVGMKPDYPWLKTKCTEQSWSLSDCAFVGDRPTMDMWMAYRAGMQHRVWVQGYLQQPFSILRLFRKIEIWLLGRV